MPTMQRPPYLSTVSTPASTRQRNVKTYLEADQLFVAKLGFPMRPTRGTCLTYVSTATHLPFQGQSSSLTSVSCQIDMAERIRSVPQFTSEGEINAQCNPSQLSFYPR